MNVMSRTITATSGDQVLGFTTAEFARMCEVGAFDDMTVDLIDGRLERMNKPMAAHAGRQAMIVGLLWNLVGGERPWQVQGEIGIDLGGDTVLACDAALLRAPLDRSRWPRPDEVLLAVEVSETTLARDLGLKVPRYAAAGIGTCWIVDGEASVTRVHRDPVDGGYRDVRVIPFADPLPVPGTDAAITLA